MASFSRQKSNVPMRLGPQGGQFDSNFFQKLVDLQKEVGALAAECEALREDGKRRQDSYLRREAQMASTIEQLESRQRSIAAEHELDDDAAITKCQKQLEEGINALLEKQRRLIGQSKIDGLEKFDEKLKAIESSFQQKSFQTKPSASGDVTRNRKTMEAMEELTNLRKTHAALQEKYRAECEKTTHLRTECECLKDREALLTRQLVEHKHTLQRKQYTENKKTDEAAET